MVVHFLREKKSSGYRYTLCGLHELSSMTNSDCEAVTCKRCKKIMLKPVRLLKWKYDRTLKCWDGINAEDCIVVTATRRHRRYGYYGMWGVRGLGMPAAHDNLREIKIAAEGIYRRKLQEA